MTTGRDTEIRILRLTLHGHLVSYLAEFHNGRNVLSYSEEYQNEIARPTLSLITHPNFPHVDKVMAEPWSRNQRLHPALSNLLTEGALRELIAQTLGIHIDGKFQMLSYLGQDLPGAIVAEPLQPEEVPDNVLTTLGQVKAIKFDRAARADKFSLAGVQMKFSMRQRDGRYSLAREDVLGDWIIKTPSTRHKDVPWNEYTAMTLASLIGVEIPDMKLVELDDMDNLPPINLPDEKLAFAIRRSDREQLQRVYIEDFAQVIVKNTHEKYKSASYQQLARILYQYSGDGLADVQQFARRLLANIPLANGDAQLNNWSLIYSDKVTPRQSPAYDIVTTSVYIDGERRFALNLGGIRDWHEVSYATFEVWARKSDIPWRAINPHLDEAMDTARNLWPVELKNLPMNMLHKNMLIEQWNGLHKDFAIRQSCPSRQDASLQELVEFEGWFSYEMVLRYAYLASDHLQSAAIRNFDTNLAQWQIVKGHTCNDKPINT